MPGQRNDRGETMLELLIAVTIMAIAVVAVVGGLGTSILISDVHRKQATAGDAVRNYAETMENLVTAGGYKPCGSTSDYTTLGASFTPPAGYQDSVVTGSMRYWASGGGWQNSCSTDTGLQQLTLQVASSDGRASEQLVIVLRKRCGITDALC
ncbi:MAG TPA: type II secretion system protein [Pseudonocardiaceae bacterium]|jgi:type II secretory pathway pseudopilin PulG